MRLTLHILRMHIGPFLFGTFAVVFIFLLQFIFRYLNDLVGKGLSYGIIAEFIFYNLAWMLVLAVPMGVLFSTLMAYGKLSGQNELTIIKSSGGSAFRAMIPAILVGGMLATLLWLFNDRVLPDTNHKAHVMQVDIKAFRPTAVIDAGRFVTLQGHSILAREVDRENDILYNVSIYNRQGPRLTVINATKAELAYDSTMTRIVMTLFDGEVQRVNRTASKEFRRFTFRSYMITLQTQGNRFQQTDPTTFGRNDRTMNIAEMQAIVDTALASRERTRLRLDTIVAQRVAVHPLTTSGTAPAENPATVSRQQAANIAVNRLTTIRGDVGRLSEDIARSKKDENKYLVEIYKKYAIPAACLIFVFVGAPLGIVVRRGNFGVSAVIALGFYVLYWACLVVGEKLADRAVLHPAIAMYLGDIVVGVLGIYLTTLVSRETVLLRLEFPRLKAFFKKLRRRKGAPTT